MTPKPASPRAGPRAAFTVGITASGNGVGLSQQALSALPAADRAVRIAAAEKSLLGAGAGRDHRDDRPAAVGAAMTVTTRNRLASRRTKKASLLVALIGWIAVPVQAANYQVYVTNERSGDVTVINGGDFSVAATIPVGKRPRGIHVSPDGKTVYVALSGTPIEARRRLTLTVIRYSRRKRVLTMMTPKPTQIRPPMASACSKPPPRS